MLFTRLQWDAAGEPLIPGGLGVWQQVFARRKSFTIRAIGARRFHAADGAEGFLEA